jgi:hypothetical protein
MVKEESPLDLQIAHVVLVLVPAETLITNNMTAA